VYFIGKSLWAKGYDRLLDLLQAQKQQCPNGQGLAVELYGSGPDRSVHVFQYLCVCTVIHRGFQHCVVLQATARVH
jgi:hypothetical protein